MTPHDVLRHPALVLERSARERYFEDGVLVVPGYVGTDWLTRLRAVVAAKIQESRALTADKATELCGPAGTVVVLHCRVVHGSAANDSSLLRPLLLNVYAAADALPITPAPTPTSRTGVLVRGAEPAHVHMEPYPARLPPRWDQVGYRSIFTAQKS